MSPTTFSPTIISVAMALVSTHRTHLTVLLLTTTAPTTLTMEYGCAGLVATSYSTTPASTTPTVSVSMKEVSTGSSTTSAQGTGATAYLLMAPATTTFQRIDVWTMVPKAYT